MICFIPTKGRTTTKTYKLFEQVGIEVRHFIEPQEIDKYPVPNKVSILENMVLSAISYYFIMSEDLDDIYSIKYYVNSMPNLIIIGKMEKMWCKYYSWIGITISANYYCNNRDMTPAYMYILCLSIFRLYLLRFFENKKLKN